MARLLPEQLLGEIEDLLRTVPSTNDHYRLSGDALEWTARASAVLAAHGNVLMSAGFDAAADMVHMGDLNDFKARRGKMLRVLHQVRFAIRMETVGPIALAIGAGQVFDYFDAVRQVIEAATSDLLFVDPYLTPDFVTRYLPHVKAGVKVRLLGQKGLAALVPAVDQFSAQFGHSIEVRGGQDLHDRWVIVDGSAAYQSGASFKDGGRTSPTTLTQAVDAFDAIRAQYEERWLKAQQHR